MSRSKQRRVRRQRHQQKAVLKFGPSAKPRHTSKSGRTGKVRSTALKSLQDRKRHNEDTEGEGK